MHESRKATSGELSLLLLEQDCSNHEFKCNYLCSGITVFVFFTNTADLDTLSFGHFAQTRSRMSERPRLKTSAREELDLALTVRKKDQRRVFFVSMNLVRILPNRSFAARPRCPELITFKSFPDACAR